MFEDSLPDMYLEWVICEYKIWMYVNCKYLKTEVKG